MKLADIKIGRKYKIVGDKGCCSHTPSKKCNVCPSFKKGIIVSNLDGSQKNNQVVNGVSLVDTTDNCYFCPEDLELIEIIWKELI